jgi:SpoVK/Ycf46/Vps4 family AAA+-type ATPase
MVANLKGRLVRDNLTEDAMFTFAIEDIPQGYQLNENNQTEDLSQLLAELDRLIGLEPVKQQIRTIVDEQLANQRLQEAGYAEPEGTVSRHFSFTGNPGTGKTTVARLIGRIFRAMGLLRKGHFVEATRSDFVAGYVGQTEPKTREVINSALGGVLFIDEAYALSRGGSNDFGQEAINVLVPEMENQRDQLIVILAGYSQEMEEFFNSNSGLNSRIPYHIHFPDYNAQELNAIFLSNCEASGRICPPEVRERLESVFQQLYENRDQNFGNGRDVRNFYEAMVANQKRRFMRDKLTGEAMVTFAIEDIPEDYFIRS